MNTVFALTKHTSARIYIYDSQFVRREALHDPDSCEITNLNTMGLLGFDLSALKSHRIREGVLTLKLLTPDYSREMAVTTVSDTWDPRFANNYTAREATPWGGDKWLCDVIMSNGGSFYRRVKTSYHPDTNTLDIPIPGDILQAMASGISDGFGLIDTKSRSYGPLGNATFCGDAVHKRYGMSPSCGFAPRLEVIWEEEAPVPVPEVRELSVMIPEQPDTLGTAAAELTWQTPALEGFHCYHIYMAETAGEDALPVASMSPVPRRMIPAFLPGKARAWARLEGLKPDTEYLFAVTVSSGLAESRPRYIRAKTLSARRPLCLELPGEAPVHPQGTLECAAFSAGVLSSMDKADPVTGENYFSARPLMPLGSMAAAPGEKLAFQLLVENRTGSPASFTAAVTHNAIASRRRDTAVTLSRCWYLKIKDRWYPDALVSLDGAFSIPWTENAVEGQRFQALFVDIMLPPDTAPGKSTFTVTLILGENTLEVPFCLEVADVRLKKADFAAELNGYVCLAQCAGYTREDPEFWEAEQEYYRLAQENGMVCNILPYFHTGIVQEDFAPKVEMINGVPRVTDWSAWDAHFEKYLSGSYTLDTQGRRHPVSHIYLPFHENWPMAMKDYYRVDMSDFAVTDYPENINQHKLRASSLWEDFAPGYREGIKAVMKDFIRHIDEKGWNGVAFQYFLNNKHFYKRSGFLDANANRKTLEFWLTKPTCGNEGKATSWWLLDEPNFMDDWDAIAYYGSILREARAETGSGENIRFRADLSCYNLMFDHLDDILDIGVCASTFYNNREDYLRDRRTRHGEDYWVYGSWNSIDSNNLETALWFLDAWLRGGQGIVPWYNYGLDYNYEAADTCAAVYPGRRFGSRKPFPSLRLKAGRTAMELINCLETARQLWGCSQTQLRGYVESFLNRYGLSLTPRTEKADDIDAGTVRFQNAADATALEDLKADLLARLSGSMGLRKCP